ncbi:MAG: aldolase/citrate lyase family protein [Paracoccaceae bacterium]
MIKNGLKELWSAGKPALNGWLSIGNSFTAEIMAAQDFDSLSVDLQHGALDYSSALPMFQAMRASGKTLLARVPWNEPGVIMKVLDAGAYGIICPMINNRAEAEQFVSSMRYPPRGARSFGPTRVNFAAGANYAGEANDEMLAIAMIETADGVANAAEIVATPGLDAIYIGPSDLTLGYTNGRLPAGQDRQEDEMIDVIKTLLKTAHDAGIRACIHTASPAYSARAIGWGFDLATVATDVKCLADAAASNIADCRGALNG